MRVKLLVSAVLKFILGLILVSTLVFLPVMTLDYINGWIFIGILFVPMFVAGICMLVKNPDLLKRRITLRERQKEQRLVVTLSGIMFIF
ncbi:MAG: isoprenylcysteine carboxylmethyltransferase family protein, partial [Clostridia bacterium]|nr:isoprenylcysteine carboxylmethyltransferase family protein [Clostridia bacterium]